MWEGHPDLANRTIWIDAVCIDQSDNAERASQVDLMGEIQGQSSLLVVWLGNVSPRHRHMLSVLKTLRVEVRTAPNLESIRHQRILVLELP